MDKFIAKEFPGLEFDTKEELLNHLKENESKIISLKKATIKNSEGCHYTTTNKDNETIKGIDGLKQDHIYAVINTTNIMDSHNDVHLPKIWNQSLKEQKGRVFYVTDHDLKIDSVIAFPKDVSMSVKNIDWKDLGENFEGKTQALIFEVAKDKVEHKGANNIIENKLDIEHSVRMQYVKMELAINSEEKEDKEYKKIFDKHINQIANKQVALDNGYFWAVTEAKIVQEGSMVLRGSNGSTPLLQPLNDHQSNKNADDEAENSPQVVVENKKRRRFV